MNLQNIQHGISAWHEYMMLSIGGLATHLWEFGILCRTCDTSHPTTRRATLAGNIFDFATQNIYNKYHDKGLEIISVSLDGSPRQKNSKDAWIKAIEKDNLTWYHISHLSYFNDPIAKQYHIQSIPSTFILDSEGIIIAKNLRGKTLENKIAELLN